MIKTLTWTTKTGKNIEVKIDITREVVDNTANLDGDIVNLGRKTQEITCIEVFADGKFLTRSLHDPEVIDAKFYRNYSQLRAAGAYARLGDTYISEAQYNRVMEAITEINMEIAAAQAPEFAEIKAREIARKQAREAANKAAAAEYAQAVKNGLCPKCGTYCYGDCGASQH